LLLSFFGATKEEGGGQEEAAGLLLTVRQSRERLPEEVMVW
jgi:hypothetical protein